MQDTFEDTEEFRYPLRVIWDEMQPYWARLDVKLTGLFRPSCLAELEKAVAMARKRVAAKPLR